MDLLRRIGQRRAAERDRRRHVRRHPAARRRRPGPGRRVRAGGRLLQPGERVPGGPRPAAGQDLERQRHDAARSIRPYGDTTGDGRVQLSFTLPVPFGTEEERAVAEGAALQLAAKMGLEPAMVVHAKGDGPGLHVLHRLRPGQPSGGPVGGHRGASGSSRCCPPPRSTCAIRSGLGRELVVLGACIGTDAHTVGIDAILNVKGHAGEKGLEYYREIRVVNLGAQVDVADLVARAGGRARGRGAGQPGRHPARRAPGGRPRSWPRRSARAPAAGGSAAAAARGRRPPVRPAMAAELGVDKIFGRGTTPREVASYLVHALTPGPADGRSPGMTGRRPARGPVRHPPPLRPGQPRPLRRQPGRRRLRAGPVRRRGHRGWPSARTATRACSPPTPTSSSWRRCWPET